jgi:hypothetical protein
MVTFSLASVGAGLGGVAGAVVGGGVVGCDAVLGVVSVAGAVVGSSVVVGVGAVSVAGMVVVATGDGVALCSLK